VRRVKSSRALFVLLAGVAAAAAVALNLLLLGSASAGNDPVGQLRPRTSGTASTSTPPPAAPAWTVRPTTGQTVERDGADD